MVFTPRRRRLFRAILVGLIFTGCVLIFQRWNSDLRSGSYDSKYVPRIAKHGRNSLDYIYNERKTRRQDVNVTKVLVINTKKQTPTLTLDATKNPNITWIQHPWTSSLRGFLNVHVWLDWCGSTVNDLRRNIHFPKYPDIRLKTNLFHLSHDAHNFGQRVFGFLHPPKTGRYTFAISSDDSSELWLSSDDDPKNSRLIAWVGNLSDPFWQEIVGNGEFTKYESQISAEIYLRRNRRYFVEALHKQSTSSDHLLVSWKIPRVGNFSHITRGRVSQYIHPHELHNLDVTRYAWHIPLTPAVLRKPIILQKLRDQVSVDTLIPGQNSVSSNGQGRYPIGKSDQLQRSSNENLYGRDVSPTGKNARGGYPTGETYQATKDIHINMQQLKNDIRLDTKFPHSFGHIMYPSCDYKPSYRVDFNVARYEGVYLIHETAVYPDDRTHLKHVEYYKPCYEMRSTDSHGELLPGVEQSENVRYEQGAYEERWNEGRGEDHNNVGLGDDTTGNITTVDYRESNFSRRKSFHKRKILEVIERENDRNNSKYGHTQDGGRMTSRLVMTSPRSHDNKSRGKMSDNVIGNEDHVKRKIERGNDLKNSDYSVITKGKGNSDESLIDPVKKSTKTSEHENINHLERPVKRVEGISNARINHGSNISPEQTLNKGNRQRTKNANEHFYVEGFTEKISNARINRGSTVVPEKKRNRERTKQSRVNEDFEQKTLQSEKTNVQTTEGKRINSVKSPVRTVENISVENKNRKVSKLNMINSQSKTLDRPEQNILKERGINISAAIADSLHPSESWQSIKERIQKRRAMSRAAKNENSDTLNKRNALGQNSVYQRKAIGQNSVNQRKAIGQNSVNQRKAIGQNSVYQRKAIGQNSVNQRKAIGQRGTKLKEGQYNNHKPKLWHRKRHRTRAAENILIEDSSPLASTFRRLKESGQWREIKEYAEREGLLLTKKTWMYVTWKFLRYEKPKKPHDKLVEFVYKQNPTKCRTDGNILLNEVVAKSIVKKYMKDLRNRYGSEVYLKRIVNVEENHDVVKGDRYLIELDLGLNGKDEAIRVSDYLYLPLGAQSFCSPRDFVWRKNITVHVIVPVKDQGKWVQHFINDMAELYERTQDANVNVIIVDFNSTDIDIEQALKRSSLKRYRFLQVNGSFQRALGVQIGADVVENPDDIIFTCDLHLDIPNNMIEVLRKHCIQGKMAFSPMVLRLECGFTPTLPYGEWETMGYGLFAIYKSDFDRIGGMNIDEFKTKWGGEDWEMVDRCLQKGMEIERFRVPNFYHSFHSKQGMWGSYGFEDNVSGDIGDNMVEDELVPVYDANADNAMVYSYNQPLMPEY